MLAVGKPGLFAWEYSLANVPTTVPGVSLTPGTTEEGAYVQVCSGANMAYDCFLIRIWVNAGNTSATIRDILIDLGVDPAGGTSYSQVQGISDIWVPQAGVAVAGGYFIEFPFFIKAGSSVAARAQSNVATGVRCAVTFYGRPAHPEFLPVAQYVETVGVSGVGGTPVVCGNAQAEGSWTLLGTTTRNTWLWFMESGHNIDVTTAQMYFFDLAWSDNGTDFWPIITNQPHHNEGTSERTSGHRVARYADVPAGASIYARGSASGTAETTEVVAHGFGG